MGTNLLWFTGGAIFGAFTVIQSFRVMIRKAKRK